MGIFDKIFNFYDIFLVKSYYNVILYISLHLACATIRDSRLRGMLSSLLKNKKT